MTFKQLIDILLTIFGLIILSCFMLIIAIWIKADSAGPALFRQRRVGKQGKLFYIYKFRTMVVNAELLGPMITIGKDNRVTRCGIFLRKYKVDELPQLFNILLGQMSLVGPRPEVFKYVELWNYEDKKIILSVLPGITDLSSLHYSNEQSQLDFLENPEWTYINVVMQDKIRLYKKYVTEHNACLDIKIILATILKILGLKCYYVFLS